LQSEKCADPYLVPRWEGGGHHVDSETTCSVEKTHKKMTPQSNGV